MKLTYFESQPANFGDELNSWMWPRILPHGFLDDDPSELFVGIGSILHDAFPHSPRKYVMGSGYGGYEALPDLAAQNWSVVFVRGPVTARLLNLDSSLAICDSAVLLRTLDELPQAAPSIDVAFMPHFDSLTRGHWQEACNQAGVTFLDPTGDVELLLSQIRGARLVVTEAMHGAIVADTLRVPWIAVRPFHRSHHMKWQDWSGALGLTVDFRELPASSIKELAARHLRRGGHRLNRLNFYRRAPFAQVEGALVQRAALALRKIASDGQGQLSELRQLDRAAWTARAAVEGFVARHRKAAA